MNIKFRKLLLIGSIVLSVMLSSCKKDKDDQSPTSEETGTFTDNRDGKTYNWIKIGNQIWMSENLAYTGSDIQHITSDNQWENNSNYDGWCYYDNDSNNENTYGVLYQLEAAKIACPSGWHLPTDDEWTQLETYLKQNGYSYDGVAGHNGIAKSLASKTGWSSSNNQGAVGNSDYSEYQNKSGFTALPGGYRWDNGNFHRLGDSGIWWSSTDNNYNETYYRYMYFEDTVITRFSHVKTYGFSVRCIKD